MRENILPLPRHTHLKRYKLLYYSQRSYLLITSKICHTFESNYFHEIRIEILLFFQRRCQVSPFEKILVLLVRIGVPHFFLCLISTYPSNCCVSFFRTIFETLRSTPTHLARGFSRIFTRGLLDLIRDLPSIKSLTAIISFVTLNFDLIISGLYQLRSECGFKIVRSWLISVSYSCHCPKAFAEIMSPWTRRRENCATTSALSVSQNY